MNEREKLKVQLDQNRIDQDKLIDEQGKLQDELCELEEPKYKQGDYGLDLGFLFVAIKDQTGRLIEAKEYDNDCLSADIQTIEAVKLGNIFDDLKRNSEDLEEFRVVTTCCSSGFLNVLIVESGINFNIVKENRIGKCFTVDEATEIHQKLGQLIATAKRKQSE